MAAASRHCWEATRSVRAQRGEPHTHSPAAPAHYVVPGSGLCGVAAAPRRRLETDFPVAGVARRFAGVRRVVPAAARGRWARAALIAGVAVPRAFPEASAVPSRKNGFELRAGSTGVREVRAPINEVLTPLGALSPCASVAALVACAVCEGPPPNAAPARTPGPALGCENGETAGRARRMPGCI